MPIRRGLCILTRKVTLEHVLEAGPFCVATGEALVFVYNILRVVEVFISVFLAGFDLVLSGFALMVGVFGFAAVDVNVHGVCII